MSDKTIPRLGLGTYGRTGSEGVAALRKAIEIGYRHLDTAQSYDTEQPVGEAVRRSGVPRGDFFITTKVADTHLDKAQFMPSVRRSLDTIGVDQVDLLLIHWPSHGDAVPFEDYMTALVEAQRQGYARLIGVSNYPIALLEKARALLGKDALATNQVEIHPYLQSPKLVAHARKIGLRLTAYQPLAKGEIASDPVLRRIAEKYGTTVAAVALAFLIGEGHIVIPASGSEANLRANFAALDVSLGEADMAEIRRLDRGYRRINPEKSPGWDD
ncbi:aldo/keto reductase [Neorhizobium sp. T7_12]|uniref:aldo/keto reductase n=1 Tax=Neorhizobium sp. T7_12 TaxID=2093832 RepID=UPI000CF8D0D2|nr:aldo/keto reductase [Neorhizobium sp. T7_12]